MRAVQTESIRVVIFHIPQLIPSDLSGWIEGERLELGSQPVRFRIVACKSKHIIVRTRRCVPYLLSRDSHFRLDRIFNEDDVVLQGKCFFFVHIRDYNRIESDKAERKCDIGQITVTVKV